VERRHVVDFEPDDLTRTVRAARTRRGLLSSDIARESGVDVSTVIRVLSNDLTPPDPVDADRLLTWAGTAPAPSEDSASV